MHQLIVDHALCAPNDGFIFFLPIRKEAVQRWLRKASLDGSFPSKAKTDNLLELLWKKEELLKVIFDTAISNVCKYHIESFFLHMIAVRFIGIEKKGDNLFWTIMKSGSSHFDVDANFEIDGNWKHVNTYADDYAFTNSLTS